MDLIREEMKVMRKCCFMNPSNYMQYVKIITSAVTQMQMELIIGDLTQQISSS